MCNCLIGGADWAFVSENKVDYFSNLEIVSTWIIPGQLFTSLNMILYNQKLSGFSLLVIFG